MYKVLALFSLLFISSCAMIISPFYSKQRDNIFQQALEIYKKTYVAKEDTVSFYDIDKAIKGSIIYFNEKTLTDQFFKRIDLTKKVIYFPANTLKVVLKTDDGSLVIYNNGEPIFLRDVYSNNDVLEKAVLLRQKGEYEYIKNTKIKAFEDIILLNNNELTEDYLKFIDLNKKWEATHYSETLRATILEHWNPAKSK